MAKISVIEIGGRLCPQIGGEYTWIDDGYEPPRRVDADKLAEILRAAPDLARELIASDALDARDGRVSYPALRRLIGTPKRPYLGELAFLNGAEAREETGVPPDVEDEEFDLFCEREKIRYRKILKKHAIYWREDIESYKIRAEERFGAWEHGDDYDDPTAVDIGGAENWI